LRENLQRKKLEHWCNHNWLLHYDNTPLKTTEFVANSKIIIVPHPPCLPDLVPFDFALFPILKMKLKGRHFETVPDIQRELQTVLNSIKKSSFCGAFEAWKE
jgi:hypothetical protein